MKRSQFLILALLILVAPVAAQQNADCGLDVRVEQNHHATTLTELPARDTPGFNYPTTAIIPNGTLLYINVGEPRCVDGARWWQISDGEQSLWQSWIPESDNGQYVIEPYVFTPPAPISFDLPEQRQPVITQLNVPLPTVAPQPNPTTISPTFTTWDWSKSTGILIPNNGIVHDPLALQLPEKYAGDFPVPPVDLDSVHFVIDAKLNPQQLELLAQNGFVVVPSSYPQFDEVYQGYTTDGSGHGNFITTDAMLHALFLTYQNSLMFLEIHRFYGNVADFLMKGYQAAEAQYKEAAGTPLETAARNAAFYYAVPLMLIAQGEDSYVQGYENTPIYGMGVQKPSDVIKAADTTIIAAAQPMVDLALAAQGRESVPILTNYSEDFSQYKPRSYYAGNPLLEAYFRAMMWLGRITFETQNLTDTQSGLLTLRALENSGAYASWTAVADTLDFLIGPMNDYSPKDYAPIAKDVFGDNFSLDSLSNSNNLAAFKQRTDQLPPPKINSIPIAAGALTTEELQEQTRGFRLFGQRFTFDGYVMQQLIYPAVGTADKSRTLALGLDVPAVLGSDTAFSLTDSAGATGFAKYTDHVTELRGEVNNMGANDWLQNLYGGWLWALQPLAIREANLVPPMMQTDAWKHKDLATLMGSYTELKHATLLYAAQPMGGGGGGGMPPPLTSYSTIEPNPLVFARIAVVAALLDQGLSERGFFAVSPNGSDALGSVHGALKTVTQLSAELAELARKELAGEALTYDEDYYLQESFARTYWFIRVGLEEWVTNPPENTALIADVATNAVSGEALELAIGTPDLIYVITNSPNGLQVTRGAVYSNYEFSVPIDGRMTDAEWRQQVADGTAPERPNWVGLYFSK